MTSASDRPKGESSESSGQFDSLLKVLCSSIPGTLEFHPGRHADGRWWVDFPITLEGLLVHHSLYTLAARLNLPRPVDSWPFVFKPVVPAPRNPANPSVDAITWRLECLDPELTPEAAGPILRLRLGRHWEKPSLEGSLGVDLFNGVEPFGGTRKWARTLSFASGVYGVFDQGTLVYVGESGSLASRMVDLTDTRNHPLRISLGKHLFSNAAGYAPASSRQKFPDHIETMLQDYMVANLTVSLHPLLLGRKEVEESLIRTYSPRFNTRQQRGG